MADNESNPEAEGNGEQHGEQAAGDEVRTALISGETFEARPVQYTVVDGRAIFEGDIILGLDEDLQRHTSDLREKAAQETRGVGSEASPGDVVEVAVPAEVVRERAVVVSGQSKRWPGGVVPYELDVSLTSGARTIVQQAITHWQENTRLAFRTRRDSDGQWLRFRDAGGCSSAVGRQPAGLFGGGQDVNIGANCTQGNAIHEIGHAIGLWHEQSREDRDQFVTILWQNIESGQTHNFDQHISDGDDVGPYDYGSIMHYGATFFGTVDPATGTTNTTIVPIQALPPGVVMGQRNGLSIGDRGAVAWMYGAVYPGAGNTWLGRFRGEPGTDLLYYSPARRHWYLGATQGATLTWLDVGDTSGFGDLADGRPVWAGDFNGDGRSDVLFYSPGDDNWWLGELFVEDPQCQGLRDQIAAKRQQVRDLQAGKEGLDPRDPIDLREIREINRQIALVQRDIRALQNQAAGLRCPPQRPQNPTGQALIWSLVGNTANFGNRINDGRPFWIGDFNGDGRADVLFYYPGDDNWWLGTIQNGSLVWSLIGNTAGFGHGINDGRPFWTGRFSRTDRDQVLFYYPGDDNWWLGSYDGGQLQWSLIGNTAGFGHGINDGRPFWIGDFNDDGRADVLFYFPGDDNWWLGSLEQVEGEDPQCAQLRGQIGVYRAEIRALEQAKQGLDPRDPIDLREIRAINLEITALRQQITAAQGQMAALGCPITPNPGGQQLAWTLAGNTAGFGHGINDGRPFWIGDFNGDGGTDILFHFGGDLNWWRGSVSGNTLDWTLAGTW